MHLALPARQKEIAEMKELCIDARMLSKGGIGTYIRNLLPGLKASSFRLKVLIHQEAIAKEKWLQEYDLIFVKAGIYSVQEQIELPLRIPSVDLFFSPHYNIPLAPIRAKKRVVTIHDVFHLAFSSTLSWPERMYARQVIHQATRRSEAIITDSNFSASEICKYTKVSNKKIEVIHLGADRKLFRRADRNEILEVLQKYLLGQKYFLFVGNLKPHKNLTNLVLAMKEFCNTVSKDFSLVIVGAAEGMKNVDSGSQTYKQFPELQGKVHWLSKVPNEDLSALYQSAEGFIFPSYYEGFGLPALEAMSCGCPVIASSTASLPEVCGSAALYIDPHNPREITAAMQQLADNHALKQRLIEQGYKNLGRFDWTSTVAQHIELFEKIFR
ncbi:MAG TPA: glycosyltransferase family 1 protein [Chlamydiales bacterium]